MFFIFSIRILFISFYDDGNEISIKSYYDSNLVRRNTILDRNGIIIASDIRSYDFFLNRELISNPQKTVDDIQKIFSHINKKKLYERLIDANNKAKYILIKRNISEKQKNEIQEAGILGFEFENSINRIYPHKNLFSHIVGYTNIERNGVTGIELQYNSDLLNDTNNSLNTTLDVRIQTVLRNQLLKAIEKYDAKSAIGIISEIKTGNIIAIVSLPDFDPNNLSNVKKEFLFNKAVDGIYEMGSIFKVFTIANALDNNIIKENDKFDTSEVIKYDTYEIKKNEWTKQYLTAEEILIYSSNIGAALIGKEIGNDRTYNFLKKIGLLDKIPMKYNSVGKPLIPKKWRDINTYTISYGHGIAVTPLHIIMVMNGIVNNGIMKIPKFLLKEKYDDIKIINEKTSKIMNLYLRNVVRYGTGQKANILGYAIGGKTGSARLLKDGKYKENNIMANFIGVFPMNDPHFSIYIMIERPNIKNLNSTLSGGTVAAPVFTRIVENIAPILNVVPYVD